MNWRWFISGTIRQASDLHGHVRKLLAAQVDLLKPEAIDAIQQSLDALKTALSTTSDRKQLTAAMDAVEQSANKWLKPYPNASTRENIEVVLVAVAVAMGVRTFFLQPFKIPTGSMQPTLYGITEVDMRNAPDDGSDSTLSGRLKNILTGVSHIRVKAQADGELDGVEEVQKVFRFIKYQRFRVGGVYHKVWFPPDNLPRRAGLQYGQQYKKGDDVINVKVKTGDHLFVDRLTYNFRTPTRGEIIVFQTAHIKHPGVPTDQFYIKRLVALGGEKVQIGDDQHLIIDGRRLDASTQHFENVYTFPKTPEPYNYFGHVNERTGAQVRQPGLAPFFSDATEVYQVPGDRLMAMGDNTLNSLDSRAWGAFPRNDVIGKYCLVYWPISKRFGWSAR